jgi:hypothetical protein
MRSPQEVLRNRHDLSTVGDRNGTIVTVRVVVARLLVVFETLHKRHEVLGGPALSLEIIPVGGRCTGIHLEINGRTTTENVGAPANGLINEGKTKDMIRYSRNNATTATEVR